MFEAADNNFGPQKVLLFIAIWDDTDQDGAALIVLARREGLMRP